jgi:hypothetical protein
MNPSARFTALAPVLTLTGISLLFSVAAQANGPACAPWSIGTICYDKKVAACQKPLKASIRDLNTETIPELKVEIDTLPVRIQACSSDERRAEAEVSGVDQRIGTSEGAIAAHSSHLEKYKTILGDLQTEHQQFSSLEPLIIDALPRIFVELRSYLRNNELLLQAHLADLTDELAGETDTTRSRTLRFRIRSLNDLRALRVQTMDFAGMDQAITDAMDPRKSESDSLVSPLSLELFEAARSGARDYIQGADAFQRIEAAWVRAEGELQAALDETQAALALEQGKLPALRKSKKELTRAFHAQQAACDALRKRRDTGVADDLKRAKRDVQKLEDQVDQCKDDFCTNCASIIGW